MARRTSLHRNRQISEINMTPLLDLTFLLLITFMITFPLIEQGIPIRLPKGKTSEITPANTFSVTVDDKGGVFFDDIATGLDELGATLKAKAEIDPDLTILVRADERIAYGKVVEILRLMHDASITRMALVTAPVQ